MKKVFAIFSHIFLFLILVQYNTYGQEKISYIKCEKLACSIQNPFYEYKNVTAKLKGKCTNEFVSGRYFVSFYSNGILICQYDGDIIDGKLTGNGKIVYSSKDWYDVLWKSKIYEGGLENGKYQGNGTLSIVNKDKTQHSLTGIWVNGNLEGSGTEIKPNGDTYEGDFKSGVYHGNGKLKYSNGDYYIGEFEKGEKNGFGEYHTSNNEYKGLFINGKFICAQKPIWTYDVKESSSIGYNTHPLFSKITILDQGYGGFLFNSKGTQLIYEYGDKDKIIDLENFNLKDTISHTSQSYNQISQGGKYGVVDRSYIEYDIYEIETGKLLAKLKADKEYNTSNKVLFNSFDRVASIYNKTLKIHYLADQLPVIIEKKLEINHRYLKVFLTHKDKHVGVSYDNFINLYNPENLELICTFEIKLSSPKEDVNYFWDDGKTFVFKCDRQADVDYHKIDFSYLKFYTYEEGKFTFINDFPEKEHITIERKNVKTSKLIKSKSGDLTHSKDSVDIKYNAFNYFVFKDYIAIIYRAYTQGDALDPLKIFDRKTNKCIFSFNSYHVERSFVPNKDFSAFLIGLKGSTDTKNFEGYKKYVLYNTKDTINGAITTFDLSPEATKAEFTFYSNLPELKKKRDQFIKDVHIIDTLFYVTNSNDGKNFAEWINASSSDMITWDKANIFTGGIIMNRGTSPYKVKISTHNRFLKTVSALWISNSTSEVDGEEQSITMLLNPGESKQFLFCVRNVNWGYYSKGSGTGVRYRLNTVPYNLKIYQSNDSISPEDERKQKALIQEFVANNYNLKQTHKGFAEGILGVKSQINVFCKLGNKEDKISINIYSSDNRLLEESVAKKEYGSGATSFSSFMQENTTYKVVVSVVGVPGSERSYSITTKPGLSQLFIENNGNSRIEYRAK